MWTASDRNLIVGVLAFQLDLISKDDLVSSMARWTADKRSTLEDVFLQAGLIDAQTHALLGSLAEKRMQLDSGDQAKRANAPSTINGIREQIASVKDIDLDETLLSILPNPTTQRRTKDNLATQRFETLDQTVGEQLAQSRFRILRPHAKGGLGEVSVALDDELNRQVALKRIQSQFADDVSARQRFVLEAEVTGGLEHPGVVPVYGLGKYPDGRPYYAMRLIAGESLREACERFHRASSASGRDLSGWTLELRRLLDRFKDVCQTIEYAHSRGVLHRDLKPDNIMLGPYGETLVVDWGLAKASGQSDSEAAEVPAMTPSSQSGSAPTQMGSVIGTPAFMSPEQAAGRTDQIGPHSDIYSLGATLYYILVGKTALAVPKEGASQQDVGRLLQRVAQGDIVPPRQVQPRIARPLQAICLRAMALRPSDRYASPQELSEDLERFLADEPVSAFRDPLWVRTQRWIRRHQTLAATTAVLVLVSSVGLAIFSGMLRAKQTELEQSNADLLVARQAAQDAAYSAESRRKEAEQRRQEAERAQRLAVEANADSNAFSDFLVNKILAAARPAGQRGGLGIDAKVIDAIASAEESIESVFAGQPTAEAITRAGIGDTWSTLGKYDRALKHYVRAAELTKQEFGGEHLEYWKLQSSLATALKGSGKLQEAVAIQEAAESRLHDLLGEDSHEALIATNNLALSLAEGGDYPRAATMLRRVVAVRDRSDGPEHPDTLSAIDNLANCLRHIPEQQEEAGRLFESLVPVKQRILGETHPDTLSALNNLATYYGDCGRAPDAIAMLQDAVQRMRMQVGERHPATLTVSANLAYSYQRDGQLDVAIELLRQVIQTSAEVLGDQHPDTLNSMDLLAETYSIQGDPWAAAELYEKALAGKRLVWGETHSETLRTMNNLALEYDASGNPAASVELLEFVLAERLKQSRPDLLEIYRSRQNLAAAYSAVDLPAKASRLYEQCLADLPTGLERAEHWRIQHNLAANYISLNRAEEALAMLQGVVDQMKSELPADDAQLQMALQGLAVASLNAQDFDDAKTLFVAQVARQRELVARSADDGDRSFLRGLLFYLAKCHVGLANYAAAETTARESLDLATELLPDDWRRFNTQSLLGEALLRQGKLDAATEMLVPAHQAMLERIEEFPPDLAGEYLGESFDRLAALSAARQLPDEEQQWLSRKRETLQKLFNSQP